MLSMLSPKHVLAAAAALIITFAEMAAAVRLPSLLSDGMVLQRDTSVSLWGSASPGSKVAVKTSWDRCKYITTADNEGQWKVSVVTGVAGGPYTITIKDSDDEVTLDDILLGDVWVCSGQSNMEMPLNGFFGQPVLGSEAAKREASKYHGVRLFKVMRHAADTPQDDCEGQWKRAGAGSAGEFSAVGWFFGTALSAALDIPIGMISSAWSGAEIERWMMPGSVDTMAVDHGFQDRWHRCNGQLWNGMIVPLTGFAVKGFIWYQGESNEGNWQDYALLQTEMVRQWREAWGGCDIPFYYVQIAPYERDGADFRVKALLMEQQYRALEAIPNSAIAPTGDIGSEKCIHPMDKKTVGDRLSALALVHTYGMDGVSAAVPMFSSMEISSGKAILHFAAGEKSWSLSNTDISGHRVEPEGFEISGPDSVFVPAKARIAYVIGSEGLPTENTIEVWSEDVPDPVAVRHGFRNYLPVNVTTTAFWPLPPFRTDDWPIPPEEISLVSHITPGQLRCEWLRNPVVDIPAPRLSWINSPINQNVCGESQSAYRIMVASTKRGLSRNEPDVWDSGKVDSWESSLVEYAGAPLESGMDYWWKVMVWDSEGRASQWSSPAHWITGFLDTSEWTAKWIGAPWQGEMPAADDHSVPMFRRTFSTHGEIRSAKAFVTGLGFFELFVNGRRAGDPEECFAPPLTDYSERDDLMDGLIPYEDGFSEYRVMYEVYDVTGLLKDGDNAIAAWVAGGYFHSDQDRPRKKIRISPYGSPRLLCQLEIEYADGSHETVISDERWKSKPSPIVLSDLYGGEVYDSRLETAGWNDVDCDDIGWETAVLRNPPAGHLLAATAPHDRVLDRLKPVSFERQENGSWNVDFGRVISGWIRFRGVRGHAGDTLKVFFPNEIPGRGFRYIFDEAKNGDEWYVFKDDNPVDYAPRFDWYAFREAVISGVEDLEADDIIAEIVGTDVPINSEFHCSDTLFEHINAIWRQTQVNNMHASVAMDCPDRERLPYLGDGQVVMRTVLCNFDAAAFYSKWIADIRASQDPVSGFVPNSAPWEPHAGGGVGFGAAMDVMPWDFYLHYGDRRLLEDNFEAMKAYVRYLESWRLNDGTILVEKKNPVTGETQYWFTLGDWAPSEGLPDKNLVHTFFMWQCASAVVRAAAALGKDDEAADFQAVADGANAAFHKKFYQPEACSYGDYGGNVFALAMDIPETRRPLVARTLRDEIMVKYNGHLNTGLFSTRFLLEILARNGLNDVAFTIMNQRDIPSFGWWIDQGATTFWEYFNGDWSHNHPMYGGCLVWFYQYLAGVNPDPDEPGFRHFTVKPVPANGLDWASYSCDTPYGRLFSKVEWREGGSASIDVTVPVGSRATVHLPIPGGGDRIVELGQGTYHL